MKEARKWGALLVGTSLATLALPGHAQTAPKSQAEAMPTLGTATRIETQPTNDVGPPSQTAGDIVVTARRRAERLQDVPVAITAITGEQLATKGITNIEQVRLSVPALQVSPSPFGPSVPGYTIRSQRQLEQIISQDPSVGVYFADVVQTRPHGSNQSLYDIDSIQVLKGPQGTLFGRNTTGGAVLVTPTRPKLDDTGGYITGLLGNYALRGANGAINLSAGSTFAIRLAGKVESRDGFALNLSNGKRLNDENLQSFRVGALWKPTDWLESYTLFDYFHSNTNGTAFSLVRVRPGSLATKTFPGVTAALARQQARDPLDIENDGATGDRTRALGISNTTSANLGSLTFKNIVGYRAVRNTTQLDYDGSSFPIFNTNNLLDSHQWSEELQLLGKAFDDRLSYIVGGYAFEERGRDTQTSTVLGAPLSNRDGYGDNHSQSIFGQVDYKLIGGLTITGGLRHTWDQRDLTLYSKVNNLTTCRLVDANNVPITPCVRVLPTAKFQSTNYLVTLSYKISPDTLIYATNSTGYRSGGLNLRASKPGEGVPYQPENVTNYEIGLKTDLFDRRLRFNAAIYNVDYKDIQRTLTVPCPDAPATLCSSIVNAATARVRGGEAEITAHFVKWLTLSGFIGYSDAKYRSFITPQGVDLSGNRFAMAPETTLGGTAEINVPTKSGFGAVTVAASYYHQSSSQVTDINDGSFAGYDLVNLTAAWMGVLGKPVDFKVFVNNLADKRYYTAGVAIYTAIGTQANIVGDPRNVGASLTFHF